MREIFTTGRFDKRLTSKIDKVGAKFGAFESNEIDKRLQLEVRVTRIEKHVGIPKSRSRDIV